MKASPYSIAALILGVALIVASLTVGFGADGCHRVEGGDARRHIPADARGALVVESLEAVRSAGASFLAGVEGASGLFELLQARYGVSLDTAEGLVAAGLDPEGSLALFALQVDPTAGAENGSAAGAEPTVAPDMALVVAMSVSDGAAWSSLLRGRATLTGANVQVGARLTTAMPAEPTDATDSTPPAPVMAWGLTDDAVGLVMVAPASVDMEALFKRLAQPLTGADSFMDGPTAKAAKALSGEGAEGLASIWVAGEGDIPFPSGRLPSLIEPSIKKLVQAPRLWVASLGVSGERVSIRAEGAVPEGGPSLPTSWFKETQSATAFEAVLPRMSTTMIRSQTGLKSLIASVPSFLLDRVLPDQTPSVDRLPLPSPSRLLEVANGDLCVALLGLDTDEPLTLFADPRSKPEELVQLAHVAIGIGVSDTKKLRQYLFENAQRAREAGFAVARVGADVEGIFAHSFVTRRRLPHRRGRTVPRTYSLVLSETHNALFLVTGRGEIQRFIDVAAGRAFALKDVDTSPASAPTTKGAPSATPSSTSNASGVASTALSGSQSHVSGFAVPTRIARELADKGVPPFFLKMLSDLHLAAMELNLEERRVTFALDVLL